MGRCPRCGTDTGPMGGLCASCNERERRLRDAAQRDAAERSKRKYGTCPHSGFGLGFERLLLFVTGMTNIRDVIPFPRTPNNANF